MRKKMASALEAFVGQMCYKSLYKFQYFHMNRNPTVWTMQTNVKNESLFLTLSPYKRKYNDLWDTLGFKNSLFYTWEYCSNSHI